MPITPKNPVTTTGPKVQAIRPVQLDIEPAEGWQQKTKFGFMGYDSTPAGRLVRLADVLRWLGEHPRPLPYPEALEALCNAMPTDVMQWLYKVQGEGGHKAEPVPPDCGFEYQTAEQIKEKRANAIQGMLQQKFEEERGDRDGAVWRVGTGKITIAPPQPTEPPEPGRPALLRRIKAAWASEMTRDLPTIDHLKKEINYLAIPFDKAAQHWGWGVLAQAEAEDSVSPSSKEVELADLLEAYEKRDPKKTRKQFAMDHELTESNLKKLLGKAKVLRKEETSSPYTQLIVIGGKKVAKR